MHDLATGDDRLAMTGGMAARATANGLLFFGRDGKLFADRFDRSAGSVRGAPVLALDGIVTDPASGAAHFALSDSGDLLYLKGRVPERKVQLTWLDGEGRRRPALDPIAALTCRLSPDGRHLVFSPSGEGSRWLYVQALDPPGPMAPLIEGGRDPSWSAGGSAIEYVQQGRIHRVSFAPGQPPRIGPPQAIAAAPPGMLAYVEARREFLLWEPLPEPGPPPTLRLVTGFVAEVERRLGLAGPGSAAP